MQAIQRLRAHSVHGSALFRLLLVLAAVLIALLGISDQQYQGRITGGCSQALSPFLQQSRSAGPRAISFCNEQNADVADLVVEPIPAGAGPVTLEVAGYGDTPGISAELIGADGSRHALMLPRAGDRWMRWTIELPPSLQNQASRLVVSDRTKEGFGWIGIGIPSGYEGWIPVALSLVLLAMVYPSLGSAQSYPATATGRFRTLRVRRLFTGVGIALATLIALFLRRPTQWSHPYVWVEDGKDLLPHFLEYGWATFIHPVAGYLLVPNKLINAVSVTLSFRWLPEITLGLAVATTVAVMVALALAPTRLRLPWACALAVLAVPTDPEVFTTSAYILWWAAFLVVIPLFWDERRAPKLLCRLSMLLIGAFSSPLVVLIAPLYFIRALILRQRNEWWMVVAAASSASVQAALVLMNPIASEAHRTIPGLQPVLQRFVGNFLFWRPESLQPGLIAGLGTALALIIIVAAWSQRRRDLAVLGGLLACFVVSVLAATARVPIDPLDPFSGGPRYFFYPYAFLAWILIHLASNATGAGRLLLILLLVTPLHQTVLYGYRTHTPIDWRDEVARCVSGASSEGLRIHWTGRLENLWHAPLSADQCRQLVTGSLFDNALSEQDSPSRDASSSKPTSPP